MNTALLFCLLAGPPYETNPLKIAINATITVYQKVAAPAQGDVCNFSPSCSRYSREAFEKYGAVVGLLMTADRLMRCQPGAVGYYGTFYRGLKNGKICDPVENNYIFGKIAWHRNDGGHCGDEER